MSYIALYRSFRPQTFSDMVGQDHISEILKNQIINDRIGHAYLFSGIRGTGKTSTAKIFSRAINCINPQNGEPCNECEICKGILDGSLTDVTEIDAASNNSVDNIRNIREEVMYAPTKAKYRVYIIDEVHMLSSGAFNALLKTLEEPPKHVKFILATTEPNKLPATILSRCQRFDFKRISNGDITNRLKEILKSINRNATDEALEIIANLSDGALRDAISILDRCAANTDSITVEYISQLVGLPSQTNTLNILENILDCDAQNLIINIEEVLDSGLNVMVLLTEIIKKCKDILVYLKTNELNLYNIDEKNRMIELGKKASTQKFINLIAKISELQNNVKWANNQVIVVEAGLINLCVTAENDDLSDIKKRLEKLEAMDFKNIQYIDKKGKEDKKIEIQEVEKKEIKEESVNNEIADLKEEISDVKKEVENWKEVLTSLRQSGKVQLFTNLVNTDVSYINDNVIGIYFKTDFTKKMVERPESIEILKNKIKEILDIECEIRCFLESDKKENTIFDTIETKAKEFNIPLDVVDE